MTIIFYMSAAVALIASILAITRANAVHALLYAIVSLLAVSVVFFLLGAPFAAALEVIIYAGAIMVLFVFVVMMINSGPGATEQERQWMNFRIWLGPSLLAILLAAELIYISAVSNPLIPKAVEIGPKQVGISLLGTYMLGMELSSLLLMSGLIGAYHLGRRQQRDETKEENSK